MPYWIQWLITRALDGLADLGEYAGRPAALWHDHLGKRALEAYERVIADQKACADLLVRRAKAEREFLAQRFPDALKPPDLKATRERMKTQQIGRGVNLAVAIASMPPRRNWTEN